VVFLVIDIPPYSLSISGLNFPLVDGVNNREVTEEMKKDADDLGRIRREKIKDGMKHVWAGYKQYAW
jgi:hypothetical protein